MQASVRTLPKFAARITQSIRCHASTLDSVCAYQHRQKTEDIAAYSHEQRHATQSSWGISRRQAA